MLRRPFLLLAVLLSLVALGFLALSSAAAAPLPASRSPGHLAISPPLPPVPSSPSPRVPLSPLPLVSSSLSLRVSLSPLPLVPLSPLPLVPSSPLPLVPSSPSPLVPLSPLPLVPLPHYDIVSMETWVTEPISNVNLYTRLVMPDPALYPGQQFPAVVLVPGGTGPGAPMAASAEYQALARQGMVVVAWNPPSRGSGLPGDLQSEGIETCNGFAGQNALKAIIEYTAGRANVDIANIGVHTSSYGITMGAGALGRYPDLPVGYLVDMEGPSNNLITTFYYSGQERPMCGHYSVISDTSPANLAWWVEREAYRYIGSFDGYYLRAQAVADHAQPPGVYTHTIQMNDAAVAGGVPWARVNGLEMGNAISATYEPSTTLWLPGRLRDWSGLNAAHIADMARRVGANLTPVWSVSLRRPHDVDRLANGHTLVTDGDPSASRLLEVDAAGNVVALYVGDLAFAHNADREADGSTWLSDTGHDRVLEIDAENRTAWSSDWVALSDGSVLHYPNDANWLPGDHILITDRDNHRVLEIDRAGHVLWQFGVTGIPGNDDSHLDSPHNADRLEDGHTLIADSNNGRVLEVDTGGNIIWSYSAGLTWPRDADRLANGNTLIVDSNHDRVVEVTPAGYVAWQYAAGLAQPYDADRLANGNTLIADSGHGRVIEVDPAGRIVWAFPPGATELGFVLVTEREGTTVSKIDPRTDQIVGQVSVENQPSGMVVDYARRWAYVAVEGTNNVSAIRADTLEAVNLNVSGMGLLPIGLALTSDGQRLLVTTRGDDGVISSDDRLDVVALNTSAWPPAGSLITSVPTGLHPINVVVSHDDHYAVVTVRNQPDILILDLTTYTIVAHAPGLPSGAEPEGLDIHPTANVAYATLHGIMSTIEVIDLDALAFVRHVPIVNTPPARPSTGCFTPDGSRFYVSGQSVNRVFLFEVTDPLSPTQNMAVNLPVGPQPHFMTFMPDDRAYVANTNNGQPTGSLSIINGYSGDPTVSGPILPTLAGPIHLAYFPEQCRPLEGLAVDGPVDLLVGETGWYTASYTPISATTPVTITWDNGVVGSFAAYSWTQPGAYTITVTATNPCGAAVTATRAVTVGQPSCVPVAEVDVAGPFSLLVGETGLFTATYAPPAATLPVTLMWDSGTVGPSAAYSWTLPGIYTIAVTATNECGEAHNTLTVTVLAQCQPVEGVAVAGPPSLLVGETGLFTASYAPPTATWPVTLVWDDGTAGPTATYSWTLPGTYTLTVTATNGCGEAHGALAMTVLAQCQPVLGAQVEGPGTVYVWETWLYTASYTPLTATWPVTFTWDNGMLGSMAAYSWTDPGRYTVTVTTTNPCGEAVGLLPVQVRDWPLPCCGYYLPLVVKSSP